jgi:hypothetical protein
MLHTKREVCLMFRSAFAPEPVKLVIVVESPPNSEFYFYNPDGKVTEPLFAAMMRQLGCEPKTKEEGLCEFQRRGWVLVDATYHPVNKLGKKEKERNAVILRYYPLLRDDLAAMLPDKSVPIILVKGNVHRLLYRKLTDDGFNVINDRVVYFPSHGRQPEFHQQFGAILKSLG